MEITKQSSDIFTQLNALSEKIIAESNAKQTQKSVDQLTQMVKTLDMDKFNRPGIWSINKEGVKKWFRKDKLPITDLMSTHVLCNSNKNLGMSFKNVTSSFCIDIDNHNDSSSKKIVIDTREKVIEYLGIPYHIEESKSNGGEHLWYLIEKIEFDTIKLFPEFFKEKTGLIVETPRFMRLPLSNQYQPIKMRCCITPIPEITFTKLLVDYLPTLIKTEPYYQDIYCVINHDNNNNDTDNSGLTTQKEGSLLQQFNNIPIGYGIRNEGMLKLVQFNAFMGEPYTASQLVTHARSIDCGSKDFKKWSNHQIESVFITMMNSFTAYSSNSEDDIKCTKPGDLINNSCFIPYSLRNFFKNDVILDGIVKNYNCTKLNKNIKVKEASNIMLEYIISKVYYMFYRDRKIRKDVAYYIDTKRNLIKGFQVSNRELNLIKQKHNLKRIDMKKLYESTISLNIFQQYEINDLGYIPFETCKQYLFTSIDIETFNHETDKDDFTQKLYSAFRDLSLKNSPKILSSKISLFKISSSKILPLKLSSVRYSFKDYPPNYSSFKVKTIKTVLKQETTKTKIGGEAKTLFIMRNVFEDSFDNLCFPT